MSYPQSGSQINSEIHSGLSTQILIKVGSVTVGAIQEFTVNQAREILRWEETGTNGIVDSHPKSATKIDISVNRIIFDQMRLFEAFGRGFINLQAQRFPFEIDIIDNMTGNDNLAIVHTYHNCWFNSYSTSYHSDNYLIIETAKIFCDYVTSIQNGASVPNGGIRGIPVEYDIIERNTDALGNRGYFDSTGLNSKQ